MKKITVTLSDEGEKAFNEIMYSLPKDPETGEGCCTQSDAINYALINNEELIKFYEELDEITG